MYLRAMLACSLGINVLLGIFILITYAPNTQVNRVDKTPDTMVSVSSLAPIENIKMIPEGKISHGCDEFWKSVTSLSFEGAPTSVKAPNSEGCTEVPKELFQSHKDFVEACTSRTPANNEPGQIEPDQCFFALRGYKAHIIDWNTRGIVLSDISDLNILKEKLEAATYPDKNTPMDPERMANVAHRMLELDPKNKRARQELLRSIVLVPEGSPDYRDNTAYWDKANEGLRFLEQERPNDPEVMEFHLWVDSKGLQPDLLRANIMQDLSKNPNSGVDYYYLANLEWQAHNEELAKQYLAQAVALNPSDVRFRRTLNSITDDPQNKEPHFDFFSFSSE